MGPLLAWLVEGAVGPAVVGLPVTWAATDLAGAAGRWLRRLRRSDGLSRIVRAAAGDDVGLSDAEFAAIRCLLEEEATWVVVGRGTVEDLAKRIAACLPGRADGGSLAAARGIAAGVLEFAVRALEPELFRQVLFARLDRMQADQASALDQALLGVHADLAAQLAGRDAADAERFARVMGQLGRVLDRLPPGPAGQGEVAVYLARLIWWLNTDPWPQDKRFDGPALTPAAIERKLRVAGSGRGEQNLDADDLAARCARLVVLGGPGSGKTWLAKRTARLCAEAALDALAAGAEVDEVELPLYTTCARLQAAALGDGIRRAVVTSAFGLLPDLGGARVTGALRTLFEERDAPTLLVADSLDEAHGPDDRIRQADTLPAAWRIVLTSRPASWNRQLAVGKDDPSRRVGILQPLRYPEDVEPFIYGWFSGRRDWAAGLAEQLRYRPALQRAATVPLILAFYCIVGGDQPLPARRTDLYAKVIRRMLTGRWRDSSERDPDPDACLETLVDWAWSAAASDPVSGVGAWPDEFPTLRVRQSQADRDALDHIAPPLGPADLDKEVTQRRFIHRSIREYLVASHIASRMPAGQAAAELLNHLWYDPDWEYAAPAALAMHPQRDQVLKQLICSVTGGDQLHADLAAVDGCWELRRFLARVAAESGEGDWQREAAELIGQARLSLAMSTTGDLLEVVTSGWPTSNGQVIEWLLGLLADPDLRKGQQWTDAAVHLAVTAQERPRVRAALLGLLAAETDPWEACWLAKAITRLDPAPEQRAQVGEALLARLAAQPDPSQAYALAKTAAQLNPAPEQRARAQEALLAQLAAQPDPREAYRLAEAIVHLDPSPQERAWARKALLAQFAAETGYGDQFAAETVRGELVQLAAVIRLAVTAEERAQALAALLGLLAAETDPWKRVHLADAVARLAVTAEERAQALAALLAWLAAQPDPRDVYRLAEVVARLDPAPEERPQTRVALLAGLAAQSDSWGASHLWEVIARLGPAPEELPLARKALLAQFAAATDPWEAYRLAEVVARLGPAPEELARAREALLAQFTAQPRPRQAYRLANVAAWLDLTPEERAQAREALLARLTAATDPWDAFYLSKVIAELDPAPQERARARAALLDLLVPDTSLREQEQLLDAVAMFAVTAEERPQTREALLALLARKTSLVVANRLAAMAAILSPTVAELGGSDTWPCSPTPELLAAARRYSALPAWLAALPLLSISASWL